MATLRRCRSICCRFCCYSFLFILFVIAIIYAYAFIFIAIPGERAEAYENYVVALRKEYLNSSSDALNDTRHLPKHVTHPLIANVTQLWTNTRYEQLGLEEEITGEYATVWGLYPENTKQSWVYLGGTNPGPAPWYTLPTPYTRYNASCIDAPAVCDAYNSAFESVAAEVHRSTNPDLANLNLTFVDCDVTGGICNSWAAQPAMMTHFRSMEPCRLEMGRSRMRFICSLRITHVNLPYEVMPFTRKVWIGGRLIPAFPDHYEQLRTLIWFDGAVDALTEGSVSVVESKAEKADRWEIPGEEFEKPRLGLEEDWWTELGGAVARGAAQKYANLRARLLG
ncbi:hypothetical protein K461DRAFT_94020 [Myriangium duriaei CBS 260.36]|uniref:Uncharacterized protein n=1 Tax=Myriangium duriaei CBS 260.36 TaxID=1168546 RepID=A0A9P4J7R1_9PEZI|nr:hypothetical protein K461DRAFT_94020 [Myriangium duriaei CBS 260.36]